MRYEDLRLAKEHVNKIAIFASNIQYAESVNEIFDYKNHVLSELDKLVKVVMSAKKAEVYETTPHCYCDGCHFCWHDKDEDRYLCTARGFYVKPYQVRECGLYMKEGVV